MGSGKVAFMQDDCVEKYYITVFCEVTAEQPVVKVSGLFRAGA